jgi:DNA-binding transcriptional ArsR family regulator
VEVIAERMRLLGEPMRIRVLDVLRSGERAGHELSEALDTSQANVSKHLSLLTEAGIVARRRVGAEVLYRLADPSVLRICGEVVAHFEDQVRELARSAELEGPASRHHDH